MTGHPRRSIALLITCLFSGGQLLHAAQGAPITLPPPEEPVNLDALGELAEPSRLIPFAVETIAQYKSPEVAAPLTLRKSRRMQLMPPRNTDSLPSFLIADQVEGLPDTSVQAEGNVELRKADMLLFADRLTYSPLEDEVVAEGNVRLEQGDDEIKGPRLRLKVADQIGYFDQADYRITRTISIPANKKSPTPGLAAPLPALPPRNTTAYGKTERINFEGENQFRIENGTYSTCKPEQTDWFVRSSEIKLDYDQNEGESRDTVVYFKDVPFMYSPYLSFPLNNQRKSGLLAPTFATSTRTGLDLSVPYYWNIAPNYDATITPRAMAKRGVQLGSEVRYLDNYTSSNLEFEYMAKDREYDDRRYAYSFRHRQNLGQGFSTYINWNGASDDDYFTDLSSRVVNTSKRQLPRHFILSYGQTWWNANLQTLRYQTLNPGDETPIGQPYTIEPQLNFNARVPEWNGLDFSALGQFTHFSHPDLEQGRRSVFYPQLALPYVQPGYYITPKIGVHTTSYQLTQRADGLSDSLQRTLPIFSLDAGMTFERDMQLAGNNWTQTLEPRLYYVHIPYKDQSQFPLFDTGLADFNFGQIFSENRFSGNDRINNANQLTAAITSRLIDPETGAEQLKGLIGQRYYFSDLKVGLPGENLEKNSFSNFLVAFTGQIMPKTYVDMAWEYNFDNSTNERLSISARYQPDYGKVLYAAYRYNRGAMEQKLGSMDQIDLAAQWNLTGRWHAVARYNYAFDNYRLVEGIAGLEYNAGCWVGRFVAQRLEATAGSPNTSLFFQLELNDFGQIGSNPIQMLNRSIPGYTKINDLPSGSLITNE